MRRPSFQFYPDEWDTDEKLLECSEAAQGAWMRILCYLHRQEEYGVARMPLRKLAKLARVSIKSAHQLASNSVLKGGDSNVPSCVYRPRHAGKLGAPVTLLEASAGPMWYSRRFLKDEWLRTKRGGTSRFTTDNQPTRPTQREGEPPSRPPTGRQGERQGDGAASASAVHISNTVSRNEKRAVHNSPGEAKAKRQLADQARAAAASTPPPAGSVAAFVEDATGKRPRSNGEAHDDDEHPEKIPDPTPRQVQKFRLGDDLLPDWRESAEGIDHAGSALGMARIAFEADLDYARRIDARLALDQQASST